MTRLEYKLEAAILFEYLEQLAGAASNAVGLLPWDAPEAVALRSELELLTTPGGPLRRSDLRALHEARKAAL